MFASLSDVLRLVAVPVLGWAAWRDIRTRRVPNGTWLPLGALGAGLLLWEGWQIWTGETLVGPDLFLVRVAVSLIVLVPLSYGFWLMGGFGGADAKALMALAVLFPTYPTYYLPTVAIPLEQTTLGVFSLTVLSNTVVVGLCYPLALAARNALTGHVGTAMFVGRPVAWDRVPDEYGRLLETPDGFSRAGLDLDALRMYLTWRGTTLADLRADPETHRDPGSLATERNHPGDGAIAVDGGPAGADPSGVDPGLESESESEFDPEPDDPWGAAAFLDDIDHSAYGTTPEQLREGLDVLVAADEVWITPGIPFLVPMFGGLVVGLLYGDVLFTLLSALAVV
ncbi:peptidase A24 [Halobacteriales archaeon QS_1_68_17]|nr:MAG: peptidase A24 [Halobacteriales archaeon QS_1_68_17]